MRALPLLTAAAAALLAAGCASGPSFTYDIPPDSSVARCRTIALDPGPPRVIMIPDSRDLQTTELRSLALQALARKGYTGADPKAADLWVTVHLIMKVHTSGGYAAGRAPVQHSQETPDATTRGGFKASGQRDQPEEAHQLGTASSNPRVTVVLDLVDRSSQRRAWLGAADLNLVNPPYTPEGQAELGAVLDRLLVKLEGPAK